MADLLDIVQYHNWYEKKKKTLRQFMSYQYQTIMTISILELKINLSDIWTMIHIKMFWNLLDYVQENERTKRDNRITDIVILQLQIIMHNIKDQNVLLQQYLIIINYCWTMFNVYLNDDLSSDIYMNVMMICNLCTIHQTVFFFSLLLSYNSCPHCRNLSEWNQSSDKFSNINIDSYNKRHRKKSKYRISILRRRFSCYNAFTNNICSVFSFIQNIILFQYI